MDDENKKDEPKVQADNNSIAVGGINIGGDISGNIHIGDVGYSAEEVSVLITEIQSTFQPKPFDGRCPYKGLDVFEEEDAELFFGREKLVDDLVSRVKDSRTVFVTGPSGSGKSSLVRAGLIHALKQGAIKGSERWLYATMKPGRDPIGELGRVASSLAGSTNAEDEVRAKAIGDATIFARWCEIALKEGRDKRVVLFIDQFEEVFTQISNEAERVAFLNLLTNATTVGNGRMIILFSMRSDFVSNCATYPQLNALLNRQFVQIGAMQPNELVSAIAQPALRVGLRIDPDLIAQIINEMKGEPGALPLMQFALKDLFDSQKEKSGVIALTLNDYLQRGGIRKALQRHADDSFNKLDKHEQELARSIFSGLIEIGRGTQDTRRTALFNELIPANAKAEDVEAIVQKLADARLITTDEQAGDDTVTISHEKLIDAWPWLKKLVNENRDVIGLQNEIASDAKEWEEHKRDASYLYTGGRLINVREKFETKNLVLSGSSHEFVKAGQTQQRRSQVARIISLSAFVGTIIAGVIFLSYLSATNSQKLAEQSKMFAIVQGVAASTSQAIAITAQANAEEAQKQTTIALARQLAAQAVAQAETRPDLAMLLAQESINIQNRLGMSETQETINSLLTSMLAGPRPLQYLRGHTKPVLQVAVSPDSLWIASASEDETIKIWDIVSGRVIFTLTGHVGAVNSIAFSPGRESILLASGGADGTVRLWKWEDNQHSPQVVVLAKLNAPIHAVAFNPTEMNLAVGGEDKIVRVYDLTTKQIKYNFAEHTGIVYSLAFSTDGIMLASSDSKNDLRLWDMTTGQPINQSHPIVDDYGQEYTHSVTFNPGYNYVATGYGYNAILYYVSETKDISYSETLVEHTSLIRDVAYNHDGTRFASAGEDWRIGYCYLSVGGCKSVIYLEAHDGPVNSVAFSPDDKWLVSGGEDGNVIVWNALFPYISHSLAVQSRWNVEGLAFSPDNKTLVSSNWDGAIRLWEVENGSILREFYPDQGTLGVIAVSPDGKKLAFSADTGPHRIWNIDGTVQMILPIDGSLSGVAFSPDGKWLATDNNSGKSICLWSLDNQKSICQSLPENQTVTRFAFSPDSLTLASNAGSKVVLWDLTAQPLISRTLGSHNGGIFSLAFSPDGKWLASGGGDYTIHLWKVQASQPASITLRNSGRFMRSLAFSPDGRMLVSVNEDWTVRWWDVDTGQPLVAPIKVRFDRIDSVAFSQDGKWLATGSFDGIIDVWPGNIEAWKTIACEIANRNLTRAEWKQYIGDALPYQAVCPNLPIEPETIPTATP